MKKIHLSCTILILLFFFSCKKEAAIPSGENKLLSFSITGQLSAPVIDEATHKITVTVMPIANVSALSCSFSVSAGALVTFNNVRPAANTATIDFSNPVTLNILAADGNTSAWTITVNTVWEDYGLADR